MNLDLRHHDLESVARLWREMDDLRGEPPEDRIAYLLDALCSLIGGDDASWVAAARRPTGGWRGWVVTRVQYRYPNEARRAIAKEGAAQIERGEPDVVTRAWTAGMGRSRAKRRNDLVPEREWRKDPWIGSASRAMRVEDRLQGGCAASPTAEAALLVDRHEKRPGFTPREADLLHLFVSGFERQAGAIMEATDPRPRSLSVHFGHPPAALRALGSALEAPETPLRWRTIDLILRSGACDSFQTADLARGLGMSRSSLERFVRSEWGISPGALIRQLRLEMAAELLATTAATVAAVALGAGYAGAAQFTRAFRAHFGISPNAWRRRAVASAG